MEHHEVIEKIKKARKWQLIVAIPVGIILVGSILLRGSGLGLGDDTLTGIAACLVIGGLIFSAWNWRCPVCHIYLGKNMNPDFCHKCGTKLKE